MGQAKRKSRERSSAFTELLRGLDVPDLDQFGEHITSPIQMGDGVLCSFEIAVFVVNLCANSQRLETVEFQLGKSAMSGAADLLQMAASLHTLELLWFVALRSLRKWTHS